MTNLEELAVRCVSRANDLAAENDLLDIELKALKGYSASRWPESVPAKDVTHWRLTNDRFDQCRANQKATQDDIAHYMECAAALRSRAAQEMGS